MLAKPIYITAMLGLLYATSAHSAEIYKCKDAKGQMTFSQFPCGADAKKIVIDSHTPTQDEIDSTQSANSQNRTLIQQGEKSRYSNSLYARLDDAKQHMLHLVEQRNKEMAVLRYKKSLANNNLAGAVYENSISTEMQAVSDKYATDILATQRAIASLNQQINQLNR